MGRSSRACGIALVGAAISIGCSTSVDPGSTTDPFMTASASAGDDAGSDETGGETSPADDGDDDSASATDPDDDSDPTIVDSGDPSGEDEVGEVDTGEFDTGEFDTGVFDTGDFPEGACCMPSAMPGCDDESIAECVCARDSYCCEMEWNEECVDLVDILGCGFCFGDETGVGESGGGGDCCTPGPAPGCGDPMVEDCVCGENGDTFCCEEEWDDQCAGEAARLCGAC